MLVFDIETNGLLYDVSQIHCISTYDTKEEKAYVYNNQDDETPSIRDGINQLMEADTLAGHNICLLYTSPSPRDATLSRMPSSA